MKHSAPPLALRILGTALLLAGALVATNYGVGGLAAIDLTCASRLPPLACQIANALLHALFVFFLFLITMLLANKLWGRNLFKRGRREA